MVLALWSAAKPLRQALTWSGGASLQIAHSTPLAAQPRVVRTGITSIKAVPKHQSGWKHHHNELPIQQLDPFSCYKKAR